MVIQNHLDSDLAELGVKRPNDYDFELKNKLSPAGHQRSNISSGRLPAISSSVDMSSSGKLSQIKGKHRQNAESVVEL